MENTKEAEIRLQANIKLSTYRRKIKYWNKQAYLTYSVGCCRMGVLSSRALSCNISSSTFLVLLCLPQIIIKETPSLHFLLNYIIYPSSMVCLIFLESEAFIVTTFQTSNQYLPCHISCPYHWKKISKMPG